MIKKIFLIFLSLSLFLGLTGMAWRPKRPIPKITTTIQGKVFDLDTKNPIPDVKIALSTLAGKAFFSTYTNSSGYYQINVSIPSDYYFLKASKEGYIPKTILRYLQSGKTYTIDFSLKSISPPNHPPKIIRIIPPNGSTFLAGANIKIRVYAYDPNKDPLEYQFLIGGSIKQPWSNSNTYIWQTSASDTAAVDITCQVRDNKGGQSSKTITYHIINPTIKEILQKVADNYALVNDKKMDVTTNSKFNTEEISNFRTPTDKLFKAINKRWDEYANVDKYHVDVTMPLHKDFSPYVYVSETRFNTFNSNYDVSYYGDHSQTIIYLIFKHPSNQNTLTITKMNIDF